MAESAPRVPPHADPNRRPIIVSNTSFGPFVDLVNSDEHGNNISTTSLTPSPSITAFAGGGGIPSPPTSIPSSVMRRARSSSRVVGAGGQTSTTIATAATATSIPVRQGDRSDSQASISSNIKMAADGGNEASRSSFAEATTNASGDESNAAPGVFVSNGSMSVQAVGRPLTPRSRPPATLTREGSSSNTYNSVKTNGDTITNGDTNNYNKQAATAVAVASPLTIVVARSPLNRHTPTTISRSSDSAYPVPKTPTSTSKRIAAKDEALSSNTKQQQEQQPVPSANQSTTEKENDYTYVPQSAEKTNTFAPTRTTANEIPDHDERDAITAGTPQARKSDEEGQQKKGDDNGINTNNNAASPDAIRRFEERVRLYSATRSLRTEGRLYVSGGDAASDTPLTEDSTANANNHRMIGAIMKTPVAYVRSVNNGQAVLYHVSQDNGRSEEDVRSAAVASTRAPSAAEDHNLTEHRTQEKQLFIDTTDHNVVSARRLGIVPSTSFSPSEATSAADSLVKSNNKLVYSYEFEAALATVKARVSRTEREEVSHSKMKDVTGTQQSEADEVVLMTARIGSGGIYSSSAEMRMRKGGNDYTQNFSPPHAAAVVASSPSSFVSAADRFASTVTPYPSPSFPSRRDAAQCTVTETTTRPVVAAPSSPSKGLFGNMYDNNNNYRYTNNNNNISTISGVSPLLRQTPYDSIAATPTNGFGRAVRMDEGTHTRILSPPPPPASAATCIGPSSSITLSSREDFVAALRRREEGGGNIQRDGIHRVPYVDRQQSNRHVAGGAAIREEGDSSATNPFDHTARPHTAAAAKGQWGAPHTNQISFAASTANTQTGTRSVGGEFGVANGGDSGAWKARSLHAENRHYSYSIANSHYLNPRYAYAADSTSALAAPPPALTGAKVERHAYGAEPTSPNYAKAVKLANEVDVSLSYSTSRRPRLTSVETIH